MSPYLIAALALLVLVILYLTHKQLVTSAIAAAKVDLTKAKGVVAADLPDIEADAMAALTRGMTWLTDTTSEVAAKTKADASIAKKAALKAQAAAALASSAPPVA